MNEQIEKAMTFVVEKNDIERLRIINRLTIVQYDDDDDDKIIASLQDEFCGVNNGNDSDIKAHFKKSKKFNNAFEGLCFLFFFDCFQYI